MIERPRLQSALLRRFEVPVTTITGPAGSGKTSIIELAIGDNLLDERGRDVLVSLRPHDAERSQFIDRVAEALHMSSDAAADETGAITAIHDAVWSSAPDEVALWVDDAHLLDEDAIEALGTLLERMPTNGHLVVVGRRPALRGVARRRALGQLVDLGPDDLQLDDDEAARLADSLDARLAGPEGPPRHAATAALLAATGETTASIAFLQEEVIASLSPDRLDTLRRLVGVQSFDASLARVLTDDSDLDVDGLVDGLPLIARNDGTFTLHDLLREAIVGGMTAGELRKVRSKTGEALAARDDDVGAIDAFLAAGDEHGARTVARRYVTRPTIAQAATDTRSILRRVARIDDALLTAALEATQAHTTDLGADELEAWQRLADLARDTDAELEALALHRSVQHQFLDVDPWAEIPAGLHESYQRLVALSGTVGLARGAAAHIESQSAQRAGQTDAALAVLEHYSEFVEPDGIVMRQQRLVDLGFVERVGQELTPAELAELPSGSEMFVGYAMWLRGEAPPEFAEAMVGSMIESLEQRGQQVALASTIGTAVPIALASGNFRRANERLVRLRELAQSSDLPRALRLFVAVAEASVAAATQSDAAAVERLNAAGRWAVIAEWPLRPHLLALPLCYLAQPGCRSALDAMKTGPAITRAIAAGRALVALREAGDPEPSCAVAWSETVQLRNLVLPHHLAELACAADAAGHPTATSILESLPNAEQLLRRVADQGAPIAAERAAAMLGDLPRRAPTTLRLRLLGSPSIGPVGGEAQGGGEIELGARGRVTEMLAFLALRGAMGRDDVIDHMWGGYDDDDKASANLRATITQANKLLQPNRAKSESPSYLRAVGTTLSLHHVETDVDEFERHHELGRAADTAGTPRAALTHYLDAMSWYRGDLLAGDDAAWVVLDRVRLRSLAAGTACRIAELTAARGDVEDSANWSRQALAYEPLSDRAALAFVRALTAGGDRRNAAIALHGLLDERAAAGVTPATALQRLADQLPEPL